MRLTSLALAVVLLPACSAFIRVPGGGPPVPDEVLDQRFTPEELAADLDDLFAIIEEVHPDPYTVLSRDEVARRRAALVAGLDRPLTRAEFQPRVAELVAALGDGHTAVGLPWPEWWRYVGGPQGCFPLDLEWHAPEADDGRGRLIVRRTAFVTAGGELAPGARVLSIGGRPADELFTRFLLQHSGETEAFRAGSVEKWLPMHLWLEGLEPPFALRFTSAVEPGRELEVEAPGMAWDAVVRGLAPPGGWKRLMLAFHPDGVVVLTIDTFAGDLGPWEDYLEEVFERLAADPPRALVVDLRSNGGGDSRLGDELLQYLCDRPWRQASRKEWKMSDRYRDFFKTFLVPWVRWMPVQYLHPTGWAMWTTPTGELYVIDEPLVEPRDEPLRYRGPLAWLIGPGTFSSATSLAKAVAQFDIGLLVGEPTGGVASGFGEVLPFQLPRTRLSAQVSSARHVGPSGDPSERGPVQPDLLVRARPGEAGDPVLEAAVAALAGGQATP